MAHRKWKEIKQQPGKAGPGNILGCCLVSLCFHRDIHSIHPVEGAGVVLVSKVLANDGELAKIHAVRRPGQRCKSSGTFGAR